MNTTTGTSSIAGKFTSAFALGAAIFKQKNQAYSKLLSNKTISAYAFANKKPGYTQTASVKSPYIYAESNWVDDMELAAASLSFSGNDKSALSTAFEYARQEPHTPWLGADTAHHYQWYPFNNLGHYELAKLLKDKRRDTVIGYYKEGIEKV